jgi:hypothetical protein
VTAGYASIAEVDRMTAEDFSFWARALAAPAEGVG